MTRPMIATKMYLPALRRGLVSRPRLHDRLRREAHSRLTLVSAPAGFGKTTLLAEWLSGPPQDRRVAWFSLDTSDNEPTTFWTYVVTALRAAAPEIGSHALDLITLSPLPTEQVVATVVNDLAKASGDVWLVLDDYHLIDNDDVRSGVALLLDHLPPNVHLVIGTRADPDLPLSRWRVRGELLEIRAADLRFTADEATAYLTDVAELSLPADDIAVLQDRTEGWVAALQLAALSMQGRADVSAFITEFAGNDRYIVDYLVDEVLAQQTESVREFLLHTAILDRLTGPLTDAVTGRGDGSRQLVALERANLLLVPLDDRREWYRYHHLFAEVLQTHLVAEQPELVPLLHQRASRWYELHDLTPEAVRHALAAQDFDRAARLIELAAPAIRRDRQEWLLIDWLTALPDETVRSNPLLSVFAGHHLMVIGDLAAAADRFDDAERALAAVPAGEPAPWADTEELRTMPSTIAIYRASVAQARGDAAGSMKLARHALDLAGPDDHLARAGAAGFLGLATWINGDLPTALDTFGTAVASLHTAGTLVDELSSTVTLADMWLTAGRPSAARRLYRDALQRGAAHGDRARQPIADLLVGISEIDTEAGDLAAALEHLEEAAARVHRSAPSERQNRWFVARSRVAVAEDDLEEAFALLTQAEQLPSAAFLPDLRPIAAMKARIRIRQGRLSDVADWARDRDVRTSDDVSFLREFEHLTLVRLLLAEHGMRAAASSLDLAAGLLDRLHDAAQTSDRAGSLLEIRMLQALTLNAQGRRQRAVDRLAQAWALAPEPDAYVRLYLDEGTPMTTLLRAAQDSGVDAHQVHRLLGAGTTAATDPPGPRPAPPPELLSERELQVLRLLAGDLTGPQIARELFVTHNTLRTHTKHIFTKLGVSSRRAAVRRAHELGLM